MPRRKLHSKEINSLTDNIEDCKLDEIEKDIFEKERLKSHIAGHALLKYSKITTVQHWTLNDAR